MWCVCVVRLSFPFNFPILAESVCIVDGEDCKLEEHTGRLPA